MVKILTHNINGIRAILRKNNIIDNKNISNNDYINFIKKENPDIICWNELKICDNAYKKEYPDGLLTDMYPYQYFNLSCEKKGYAGVSIISKIKPIEMCKTLDDNSTGRYLKLEFDKFILICVYVLNSGEKLKNLKKRDKWDKMFLKNIRNIQKNTTKEIIITGDLNVINREIDTHNYEKQKNKIAGVSDLEIDNLHNLLTTTKLKDAWLEYKNNNKLVKYTYFTYRFNARCHNKGMRIDYFLLSKKIFKNINNIKICDNIYGSDHLPIILKFTY